MSDTPVIAEFKRTADPLDGKAAIDKFMSSANPMDVRSDKDDAAPKVEPIEENEEKLQELIDAVDETPEKTYEQRLQEHGIDREEAHAIVDEIMNKGVYTRAYTITTKTQAVFRSRHVEDQDRTNRAIEEALPQFSGTVRLMIAKHNLAASLAEFGKFKFENTEDGFKKAYNFVGKLPHMLFSVLVNKLSKFDELVLTVMDDGAIENF